MIVFHETKMSAQERAVESLTGAGGHESHVCQQNPSYNVMKPNVNEEIYQEIQCPVDAIGGSNPGSANIAISTLAPNMVHKIVVDMHDCMN